MQTTLVIASIWPLAVRQDRPLFYPNTVYALAAASPEHPQTLTITDQVQMEKEVGIDRTIPRTIRKEDIANDLLNAWTKQGISMSAEAHPGVFLCAGETPTAEEIEAARARQTRYFQVLVNAADAYEQKRWPAIPPEAKMAAKQLGLERDWLDPDKPEEKKACPFCGTKLAKTAVRCSECGEIIVSKAEYERLRAGMGWADAPAAQVVQAATAQPPAAPQPAAPQQQEQPKPQPAAHSSLRGR